MYGMSTMTALGVFDSIATAEEYLAVISKDLKKPEYYVEETKVPLVGLAPTFVLMVNDPTGDLRHEALVMMSGLLISSELKSIFVPLVHQVCA